MTRNHSESELSKSDYHTYSRNNSRESIDNKSDYSDKPMKRSDSYYERHPSSRDRYYTKDYRDDHRYNDRYDNRSRYESIRHDKDYFYDRKRRRSTSPSPIRKEVRKHEPIKSAIEVANAALDKLKKFESEMKIDVIPDEPENDPNLTDSEKIIKRALIELKKDLLNSLIRDIKNRLVVPLVNQHLKVLVDEKKEIKTIEIIRNNSVQSVNSLSFLNELNASNSEDDDDAIFQQMMPLGLMTKRLPSFKKRVIKATSPRVRRDMRIESSSESSSEEDGEVRSVKEESAFEIEKPADTLVIANIEPRPVSKTLQKLKNRKKKKVVLKIETEINEPEPLDVTAFELSSSEDEEEINASFDWEGKTKLLMSHAKLSYLKQLDDQEVYYYNESNEKVDVDMTQINSIDGIIKLI